MPYLSRTEIEAIACRVIAAYVALPAHQDQMVTAVDPGVLAEDLLGLSVEYHRLSLGGAIHGATSFAPLNVLVYDDPEHPEYCSLDGKTIFIEQALWENSSKTGRRHFTIAHEASHQIYKMLYPKEYQSGLHCRTIHYYSDSPSRSPDDWDEWRTNALAAAILMPSDMLRLNMADLGLGEKLKSLYRGGRDYERFRLLALQMGVSTQALAIRMQQLGLLGSYYFGNSNDLITAIAGDDEVRKGG